MDQLAQSIRTTCHDKVWDRNLILRNTFILLSMTTLFSSVCGYYSMLSSTQPLGFFVTTMVYLQLFFVINLLKDSIIGLSLVFAFTGFISYSLAPVLNVYLHFISNGGAIVSIALLGTAGISAGLALYTTITKENCNYLFGFLLMTIISLLTLPLLNFFVFQLPIMELIISCGILLISNAWILYELTKIIHAGQRSYVLATTHIPVKFLLLGVQIFTVFSMFNQKSYILETTNIPVNFLFLGVQIFALFCFYSNRKVISL